MRAKYLIALGLSVLPSVASADETITYSYDAKGRMTKVQHVGGRTSGLTSTYAFDAADNRKSSEITVAAGRIVVVPLGGLRPIPTG